MAVKVYHRLLRRSTIIKKAPKDAVGWHTLAPTVPWVTCRQSAVIQDWDGDHHNDLTVTGTTVGIYAPDPFLVPA